MNWSDLSKRLPVSSDEERKFLGPWRLCMQSSGHISNEPDT